MVTDDQDHEVEIVVEVVAEVEVVVDDLEVDLRKISKPKTRVYS